MVKVAIAIGLVLLIAALTVWGSPFFAVLLAVPAVILYFALAGGAAVADEAREDTPRTDTTQASEREPTHPGAGR